MSGSQFIPSIDLTKVEIAGFHIANDPAAPTFRADPSAASYLASVATAVSAEIEEEMSQGKDDDDEGMEYDDDNESNNGGNTAITPERLVSTNLTNEDILSGPSRHIARERLLQLRHTMTSQEIFDAVRARHGVNDPITVSALMRRYSNAPKQIAARHGVTTKDVKDALRNGTTLARVRQTEWTRPGVTEKGDKNIGRHWKGGRGGGQGGGAAGGLAT